MVERLKDAIEKARKARTDGEAGAAVPARLIGDAAKPWTDFSELAFDSTALKSNRVVSTEETDPAHLSFDILRTRISTMCRNQNWTRIAVTSPTKNCGETVVATNLAFSLARSAVTRLMLFDFDLRSPNLARTLAARDAASIEPYLTGQSDAAAHFKRIGENLAVALNDGPVSRSAELLQSPSVAQTLAKTLSDYKPTLTLFDLPPLLGSDDVIGFLGNVDCVMLIVGGGVTRPSELEECNQLLSGGPPVAGVVLNRAEMSGDEVYHVRYAYGDS